MAAHRPPAGGNQTLVATAERQYVVQEHRREQQVHWDLMLQLEQTLATWQAPAPPRDWPGRPWPCRKLPDHRLAYLTYQGPIRGGRGEVRIVARGTYEPLEEGQQLWRARLSGDLRGGLDLTRQRDDQWQMTFNGEVA